MTMAVLVLMFGMALAGWNWYLHPDRVVAWAAALVVLAAMAVALRTQGRRVQDGVMLGGLIIAVCLIAPLAAGFGLNRDFAERATMVITGAFFTVTGNSLPKLLMPLSAHSD